MPGEFLLSYFNYFAYGFCRINLESANLRQFTQKTSQIIHLRFTRDSLQASDANRAARVQILSIWPEPATDQITGLYFEFERIVSCRRSMTSKTSPSPPKAISLMVTVQRLPKATLGGDSATALIRGSVPPIGKPRLIKTGVGAQRHKIAKPAAYGKSKAFPSSKRLLENFLRSMILFTDEIRSVKIHNIVM